MMHVAIDPSERRKPGPAPAAPSKVASAKTAKTVVEPARRGRMIVLGAAGCIALAGLSVAAYSAMGSLAGPQVVRPNIYQMQKAQAAAKAADWPDLRDGVPALASEASDARTDAAQVAAVPITEPPAAAEKPVTLAAAPPPQPAPAPGTPPSKALPPIEPVSLAPAPKAVSPLAPPRVAALVAPSAAQTTRARAAETTFASLPPEPAAARPKPVASVAKAKPVKAVAAKQAVQEASAEPAAPPPEPEQSEVFGLKVPSLAPAGRKIAEGVEALGNAVKNLPNQF